MVMLTSRLRNRDSIRSPPHHARSGQGNRPIGAAGGLSGEGRARLAPPLPLLALPLRLPVHARIRAVDPGRAVTAGRAERRVHAAEHAGRGVTESRGCPGVRTLVDAEGENQNDDLKDDEDDFLVHDSSSLLIFV